MYRYAAITILGLTALFAAPNPKPGPGHRGPHDGVGGCRPPPGPQLPAGRARGRAAGSPPSPGCPSQPNTFYMGVASGGVFRTTDAGESWVPITDGQVPLGSTGSIAVADSDPNIIYLGTGSDGVRSNVSTGRGVYKTTDGGETWQFAGLYDVGQIGAVRIHPTNPDIVWVAANGDIFKPGPERGVYKTTDGGESWRKTLFVSDSTGAMDVELQPGNPDVVYAWMNRIERKPWTIISGSHEGGFYKSTDGGESWKNIRTGLPRDLIGKGNLAVTAAKPDRIYALVEAKPGGGFYRSDDFGESWEMVSDNQQMIGRPFYYTTLGADPTDANVGLRWGRGVLQVHGRGGDLDDACRTPHGDNHDIWVSPNDGNIMIQANDGGANVSTDGGRTWSTQMNQPTLEIYGVWVDDRFPYRCTVPSRMMAPTSFPVPRRVGFWARIGGVAPDVRPAPSCRIPPSRTSCTAPARGSTAT